MLTGNELEILLSLRDEATPGLKRAMSDAGSEVDRLKSRTAQATNSIQQGFKDASAGLREFRKTMFLVTAALATTVASVQQAAKYNKEAEMTFNNFKIATTSLAVELGLALVPALQATTEVVKYLRDGVEAAMAGFIKAFSFIAELMASGSWNPMKVGEDIKRAMEVAELATDNFLNKYEETRARVEAGMTTAKIEAQMGNLGTIVVKATTTMEQHWQNLKKEMSEFGAALTEAATLGKGFAKAAALVAMGMAIVNTAQGITAALAGPPKGPPWPLNLAMASLVAATGAIQVATIAAVSFHKGGAVKAHDGLAVDEVPAVLQTGEGVLSRMGMAALGGVPALNSLNSGHSGGSSFGDINIIIQGGINPGGSSVSQMAEELGFAFEREVRTARGF